MTLISRTALFGKLNPFLFKSIEAATVLAKVRGNPRVELCHWLYQILQFDDSDMHRLFRCSDVDAARLVRQLLDALEKLPNGAASLEDLSADIDRAVERAWIVASVVHGASSVRGAHLLIALLEDEQLKARSLKLCSDLRTLDPVALARNLGQFLVGSPESKGDSESALDANPDGADSKTGFTSALLGKSEALNRFTIDMIQRANDGEIDPVTGRDDEIRQMIDILMRRRQNNPLLTGEAGVGKTAVVEGLALRIASGDVPPPLRDVALRVLDVGLLQAGASMKGEFEQRLKQLVDEVQHAAKPTILFIDEIHTLVGAGGSAGTGDAANLLKPALARGTLRTIGATTWSEYKKYIEKDPALTRRFQVVQIFEPDADAAGVMLRGVVASLEKHHGVSITEDALRAAVTLSQRYIPARQLPDKAIALLDTAAARVAVSQHACPGELVDLKMTIENLQLEKDRLKCEGMFGSLCTDRLLAIDATLAAARAEEAELQERWQEERSLVEKLVGLRGELQALDETPLAESDEEESRLAKEERFVELRNALVSTESLLSQLRQERPLVSAVVDSDIVASVVGDWTGIPVGNMLRDDARGVMDLVVRIEERVIGQRQGVGSIVSRIQTSRAGLADPRKPVGVFLLCGPSGVGKTETALALAERLYGGEQNLITINMSEFQESHTVSTLKGAPPGYVGYGEGGVLTEAVRRRPYSVVLLDEVEKAHPDVHELFYQVFDKGRMEDGEGRMIDFRNTTIILTSNVGSDLVEHVCAKNPDIDADGLAEVLRPALLDVFPPALLGRMVVVPYRSLSRETLVDIVQLQLEQLTSRVHKVHGARMLIHPSVASRILERCNVASSGGRMIDAVITQFVLPQISRGFLEAITDGVRIEEIRLTAIDGDFDIQLVTEDCQTDDQSLAGSCQSIPINKLEMGA
jgi:type VI secretion system protein VasG